MKATAQSRWIRLVLVVSALCASVLAGGASAATTVTLGNTALTGFYCMGGYLEVNPAVEAGATSYVVPPGKWNITSWSTGATSGSLGLEVVRPGATPGAYTVSGRSQVQALGPVRGIKTFDLGTAADPVIAVQGGDVLGAWIPGPLNGCAFGSGASLLYELFGLQPAAGDSLSFNSGVALDLNISATLVPALPTAKADCKGGGWQTFGVFENQGDCVSYVATGGKNPPALS